MSASTQQEPSLILITGMSGAGRRATAAALEELGWYVADNLPPELIVRMVELSFSEDSPIEKLAIVTDVRSRDFAGNLTSVLHDLHTGGRRPTVLYLDATDEALIARFDAVRRTHPLQQKGTLQDGIDREREMLTSIRERADIVLDTTNRSIHDLRRELEKFFAAADHSSVRINVQSFGFKHGPPKDIDLLLDARFLPNPYWDPELRPFRGIDAPVSDFVLSQPGAQTFLDHIVGLIHSVLPGYRKEGKFFVSVAIGCTGGHHRSVAIVEELTRRLADDGVLVNLSHRDLER
ncbi:RNase adaptor protein RapZ [Corynebacterium sp. HMSC08A12]|uniref:RNase adapter RapZ n=1 Tax=Corynebacterium sp. HMSC08A12 TaxID=1581134 RepID=UPI0008A5D291|nr:RNase adapter RapZ [Corynebacterium sp. HMSC08A12]OFT36071.1 RNase adaptor protein RapZ [Corynebacterium sp. HMSC08A12]